MGADGRSDRALTCYTLAVKNARLKAAQPVCLRSFSVLIFFQIDVLLMFRTVRRLHDRASKGARLLQRPLPVRCGKP